MSTKSNGYEISMDLGYVPLTINFTNGKEPVTIMFNPADTDMVRRLFEAQKMINDKAALMEDLKMDEQGMPIADDYIVKANELNDLVYEAIDYAFNTNVSENVFKYCKPFAITDGQPFVMQFLEKITPFIKDTMEKEQKKAQKYANKYLGKYMK